MMNIYIMIAIVLANLIAISIGYQFIKRLDKKQKIIFIGVSVGIIYILISMVYWFSGFGLDAKVHEQCKKFITYMFVPVNFIIVVPYVAFNYMKLKDKEIKKQTFIRKCTIVLVILVIVLILEYFYFRNMQQNVKKISDDMKNIEIVNEINKNEQLNVKLNEQTNITFDTNSIAR